MQRVFWMTGFSIAGANGTRIADQAGQNAKDTRTELKQMPALRTDRQRLEEAIGLLRDENLKLRGLVKDLILLLTQKRALQTRQFDDFIREADRRLIETSVP